jgi:transcriptional regulator with GAF, ATPase, and Fis domain
MQVFLMTMGSARSDPPHFQQALGRAGVKIVTDSDPRAACPAVIYFAGTSPELLPAVRRFSGGGGRRVLVVAGRGAATAGDLAWDLVRAGASDVLSSDGCDDPVRAVISRLERWLEVDDLVAQMARETLVGTGTRWMGLLRQVVEVARFTQASVLLTGESGTGKEEIARLIHRLDDRRNRKDLVVLDCATVVPTLSGSEFFGHEKGAFTGAAGPRDGAFALADGGILFLDEVGELPLNLQAELLRVIQEGMYKRVGGNTWHTTDFRLISATNRDLAAEQQAGRFRLDLYYRLAAWQFRLPPLRERREDIEPLARGFLARSRAGGKVPDLDPAVRAFLLSRDYPGNVRDLLKLVERISQRHVGAGPVSVGDVPDDDRPPASAIRPADGRGPWYADAFESAVRQAIGEGVDLKEITRVSAETAISVALADSAGSLAQAARSLGVTPRALQLRRAAGRLSRAAEPADQHQAASHRDGARGARSAIARPSAATR